ncbi:MAG: tRNA (adenosine(37)-N6)-threonylcarbamoyltransferase complex dimerization subunit type 1 TsaB [Desulfomicrobium sp.]|jgi:tRNA threonylcarbamoyl adenosine modification protein YeaZ|nr:tRNA (adenosine(37)-N6)-threonylcarbamoyltransferase complex dimerization subunit type 1 TsaB [Desulfomicrobium sp.]NLV96787.1 tRNA (adenosine(37)-N6)-threonylcarbamoyltransferase complex dimerization subunit type 1 TsaB [Desulfovibrionales bacterium]
MISCAISDNPLVVINCAEERAQIVLGTRTQLLFAEEIHCPGQSIVHLPTAIERGLRVVNIKVKNLAGIACVRGPGSFTGLRIAHATMYGLARPFALPMAGLEYPTLLAHQADPFFQKEIWVLTYARKKQIYMQGFVQGQPLGPITPLTVAQAMTILEKRTKSFYLVGSGIAKNHEFQALSKAHIFPQFLHTPHPQLLLNAALAANFSTQPPVPLYLRKSDAEENLANIAHGRGIDPDHARQHIFDFE